MTSRFQYPKNAVDTLFRSSSPDILEKLFPIKTPKHLIYELSEIAYHASLLSEEGRPTRFQIALFSRTRFIPETIKTYDETTYLEFQNTHTMTVNELYRLAQATDYTKTLICVDAYNLVPGESTRGLEIWGIASPGTGIKRFLQLEIDEAGHLPTCLVISSVNPGHIQLALNIRPLVILRNGNVSVVPRNPPALPVPIQEILEQGILSIQEIIPESKKELDVDVKQILKYKYFEIFLRIIFQLSENCHGLTLLFVSTSMKDLIPNTLTIKYPINCQRISLLFRECFQEHISNSGDVSDRLHCLNTRLSETLGMISNLSSVDGALVIDNKFDILGFGAEIHVNNDNIDHLHFSVGQTGKKFKTRSINDYGTRHRSAARFCNALPGAIAFVISQDGDKKIMTKVNGKVVVWGNIVWERLWESFGFNA